VDNFSWHVGMLARGQGVVLGRDAVAPLPLSPQSQCNFLKLSEFYKCNPIHYYEIKNPPPRIVGFGWRAFRQ